MAVEVIPSGSSVVVTQEDKSWAKDAERVKDVLATMAAAEALQFANVERSIANHFENTIQDVKDAESRLLKDIGDKFVNTIQDIKDAESRLTKDASDKFIYTVGSIKDAAKDAALAACHTDELVARVGGELSKEVAKEGGHSREEYWKGVRETEKTSYQNQLATMMAFKEQAMLSEKLAAHQALLSERLAAQASKELCECCCEIKERIDSVKEDAKEREIAALREQLTEARLLGRRFRTFSPVVPGTLQASDED